jgi:hypothetical protein
MQWQVLIEQGDVAFSAHTDDFARFSWFFSVFSCKCVALVWLIISQPFFVASDIHVRGFTQQQIG